VSSRLKWVVSTKETGPFASFRQRFWPKAYYKGTEIIAYNVTCIDDYSLSVAKSGKHDLLILSIANHKTEPHWKWLKLKQRFSSLNELKDAAEKFLDIHPEYIPEFIRKSER
jgi:hypothetical protein